MIVARARPRASRKYCSYAWAQRSAGVSRHASFFSRGNHALTAQKVDEMPEGSSIALARSYVSSAISQIPCRMIGADAAQSDPVLFKPSAKTRSEQNLSMNRCQTISLLTQRLLQTNRYVPRADLPAVAIEPLGYR